MCGGGEEGARENRFPHRFKPVERNLIALIFLAANIPQLKYCSTLMTMPYLTHTLDVKSRDQVPSLILLYRITSHVCVLLPLFHLESAVKSKLGSHVLNG